jgi:hypothetical protein
MHKAYPPLFQLAAVRDFVEQAEACMSMRDEEDTPYKGDIHEDLTIEVVLDILTKNKQQFLPDDGPNDSGDHYFTLIHGAEATDYVAHHWANRFCEKVFLALAKNLPEDDFGSFVGEIKVWLGYSHLIVAPDVDGLVLAEANGLLDLAEDIEAD